jgi:hypothetical protein
MNCRIGGRSEVPSLNTAARLGDTRLSYALNRQSKRLREEHFFSYFNPSIAHQYLCMTSEAVFRLQPNRRGKYVEIEGATLSAVDGASVFSCGATAETITDGRSTLAIVAHSASC